MRSQDEITAYHEAGHAVMAMSVGFQVIRISIRNDASGLGHVCYAVPNEWTDELRRKAVLICCGGLAGDFLHWQAMEKSVVEQDEVATGYFNDRRNASEHLLYISENDVFELYQSLAIRYLQVPERWKIVEEIVFFLRGSGAIDGSDLLHRWAEACPQISDKDLTHISSLVEMERKTVCAVTGID